MSGQEALKACPFCGGEAEYRYNAMFGDHSLAECRQCGARAFWKKWNTRASGWQAIETAPKDGTVFYSAVALKWKPYKPTSEQFRRGIKGRWMESNGYGGWSPAIPQPEMWVSLEALPTPPQADGGEKLC